MRMRFVLATVLFAPGLAIAQPPVGPPPVKVPNLTGPLQFKTLSVWQAVAGSTFETTHPYANNLATWKQVYLPDDATQLRLVTVGTFELENNYDFLEVWAWQNSAWVMIKRYTGTIGPALTEEFAGHYFHLKLS